jgi:flavin-dependent dehydrogenase
MNPEYDLVVIGAGPGGTSAAITSAREGARVLLLERGRFPRHKVCGEFVSHESLNLLKWLLGDSHQALVGKSLRLTESRIFLDGRTVRVPVNPVAVSIARNDLDQALCEAAEQAGVTVLQETTAKPPEGSGPFRIATSAGEFRTRAVVNASGRWSNLKVREQNSNQTRWLGLKAHFNADQISTFDPCVDLYFFDGGYCGVQPVRGPEGDTLLNACALIRPGTSDTLQEVLLRHPALAARSRSWKAAFSPLSTFPVILQKPVPVAGTICNVGDAAGFVDPFVGDGISLALRGGSLAAGNLNPFFQNTMTLHQALRNYADAYRKSLRPVYRNSSLLRKFLGFPRGVRVAALSACEKSPLLARFLMEATRSRVTELKPAQ